MDLDRIRRSKVFAIAIFSVVLLASCSRSGKRTSELPTSGSSLVSGSNAESLSTARFDSAPWESISPTLTDASRDPRLLGRVLETASKSTRSPALYMCGLIALSRKDPAGALEFFLRIPPVEIPASYLYAPYRLHRSLRPAEANPFREPILAAVDRHALDPLIQARVQSAEGMFQPALESYLRSDPAAWTDFDVSELNKMRLLAGLTRDVEIAVRAAIRGRRVPAQIAASLNKTFSAPPAVSPQSLARLRESMAHNKELEKIVVDSAVHHLQDQTDFLAGHYALLLHRYRSTDPKQVPDKTAILLVLCAARNSEQQEFGRWAAELRRRVPDPSVNTWLNRLKQDMR